MSSNNGGQQDVVTAGTTSYTVPAGVTYLHALVQAAGGGGGGGSADSGGGGGGGGAFARSLVAVTAGETLTRVVGAAGTAGTANNDGGSGGASSLKRGDTVIVLAAGGVKGIKGGSGAGGAAGAGGADDDCTGDLTLSGDDGAAGSGGAGGDGGTGEESQRLEAAGGGGGIAGAAGGVSASSGDGGGGGGTTHAGGAGRAGYVRLLVPDPAVVFVNVLTGNPDVVPVIPDPAQPTVTFDVLKVLRTQADLLVPTADSKTLSGYWSPSGGGSNLIVNLYTYVFTIEGVSVTLTEQVYDVLVVTKTNETTGAVTKTYIVLIEFVRASNSKIYYSWSCAFLPPGLAYEATEGYATYVPKTNPTEGAMPRFGSQIAGAGLGQTVAISP